MAYHAGYSHQPQGYQQDYQPPPGPPPPQYLAATPRTYQQYPQQPHPQFHNNGPPQYPQQGKSSRHSYGGPPPGGYRPRIGFTNLPAKFYVWNNMSRGGTNYLECGPRPQGEVAYSAKMATDKYKIKPGPYKQAFSTICEFESKHIFSSKTFVKFEGFQSMMVEKEEYYPESAWPVEVEVNGRTQSFHWKKRKVEGGLLKRIAGGASTRKFGDWEFQPVNAPQGRDVLATFHGSGKEAFEDKADLGVFEFHGPAANGELGDVFNNTAIATLLRMVGQHYVHRVAAKASASSNAAAGAAAASSG